MPVIHIEGKAQFHAQLQSAGNALVIVDFYATWCPPCQRISPVLDQMAYEFSDVIFLKVDVDKNRDISGEYGITSMPTFVFFKNGHEVTRFSGANESKIKATIRQHK